MINMSCPTCGGAVEGVVTTGPASHRIVPCRHRATLRVRRAVMEDVRADGGGLRCPFCGRSFDHHHDETAETSLQYHLEAKHPEELDDLETYGRPTCPTCTMPYDGDDEPFCPCGTLRPQIRGPALVPDGGRPIEEIAADDGLEPGVTPHGDRVHLVDFDSRSALVRGTDGASDKLLCGPAGNYEPGEAPENGDEWCDRCMDRFLGYKFGLTDLPEGVSP